MTIKIKSVPKTNINQHQTENKGNNLSKVHPHLAFNEKQRTQVYDYNQDGNKNNIQIKDWE